jgi:phosphoglycolate phosphatase-like HAD superfamily hydrolase
MQAHLSRRVVIRSLAAISAACAIRPALAADGDPLPSWNDTGPRRAILDFVARTTNGADAIAPEDRIAVFDNDGTLWCEQPAYVEAIFSLDRLRALAPQHPEWRTQQPYAAALAGNLKAVAAGGEAALVKLLMVTHAGMTNAQFERIVTDWIATAKHPRFGKLYTELAYQPMLELLGYLRANQFRTYICSGGGMEFIRPWSPRVYGVPPEQVIGSTIKTKFQWNGGKPSIMRDAAIDAFNDGPEKAVSINRFIGRRPVFAAGNSDGDLQMLQWTTETQGPSFGMLVHHTDAEREYAYDRKSSVGRLDHALDFAPKAGWTVVDMRADWRRIFAFQ